MAETRPAPPHGRYRRSLDGANFSLEANTEDTPEAGKFHVLQDGKTVVATEDFDEATNAYHKLCREFWNERMVSDAVSMRVAAAWGLLGLDSGDKEAIALITRDGTPQEKKRLDQAQSRRRALRTRSQAEAAKAAAKAKAAAAAAAPVAVEAPEEVPDEAPAEASTDDVAEVEAEAVTADEKTPDAE